VERVVLDHARREADSLQRWAEGKGPGPWSRSRRMEDLAEFAAMTRALVDELEDAREALRLAPRSPYFKTPTAEYVAAVDAYDQHDPPATHDQVGSPSDEELLHRLRELMADDERELGPIPEAAKAEVERQHDPPATHDQAGST
jgi:hypothetical protein